jgi:hypothetical protein
VTDTPATTKPPSRVDQIKGFVGDLARPFAIYTIAGSTAAAIIMESVGADKLTAAGLIIGALYGAKTVENNTSAKQAASVEIAKATAAAPPPDPELKP